jgi:hypothetical protein
MILDLSILTKNEISVIEDVLDKIFDAGVCAYDKDLEGYRIAYFNFMHTLTKGELKSYSNACKKLTGEKLETGL